MDIKLTNINIEPNLDADDYGERFVNCVRQMEIENKSFINLLKVDFGDMHIPLDSLHNSLNTLSMMLQDKGADNVLIIPIGEKLPIKNITVEKIEVEHYTIPNDKP